MRLEGKSLSHDFFRFILPSIAAQWVYALYTMIDGLFVSRGVGELALSGVNIAMPFVTFLFAVALLFSVGSSTLIAMKLGEKNLKEAKQIYTQNMLTGIGISLLLTGIVLWQCEPIARFLGATDTTLPYVKDYLSTIAAFAVFFICSYSLEVLIKTDGYPMKATVIVTTGAVLNCILDYVFIFQLHQGVFGAAFATGLSQLIVVLLYLTHFASAKAAMKPIRFRFDLSLLWRTVKIGFSSGLTEFSAGIVIFLFNHSILKYLNEEAIVSYTIVSYVSTIVIMSMAGIAQGIQPLVSYYYGKMDLERCKKLLRYALAFGACFTVAAFVISWVLAKPLVYAFISEQLAGLRMDSVVIFRIFSLSFLFCGWNIIIGGYFTAIERPRPALAISIARGFLFTAIGLEVLTILLGGNGIWWAAVVSEAGCAVMTYLLFISETASPQHRSWHRTP